jgi:hypothetical protein
MPGLTIKTELEILKERLKTIVSDIEWYYDLIIFKQICYKAQTITMVHIDLIENLLEEIQENNLTEIQKTRAKILLEPFQALTQIESLLKEAKNLENSTTNQ